jgi:dTDP-glucose 4,6-dehydratase
VYGQVLQGSATEASPLAPRNPYSATKAGADLLALSYHATHGLPVVVTRGSNTFGPYQYPEKLLPLFATNAIDGQPLPLYGDGRQVREWTHVLDHCSGIDTVLRRGRAGEVYNVSSGEELENVAVTRIILDTLGKPASLVRPVEDRPGHDRRYSVDAGKLRALGWRPEHEAAAAMADTVRWYRDHQAWWRPLKSGEYLEYYQRQYGARLAATRP